MVDNWQSLFSQNIKNFKGYSVGKILKYMKDPEIISFAVGMPSPDTFPEELIIRGNEEEIKNNIGNVFQYSPVAGEDSLIEAVIKFLEKDDIHISSDEILITNSGQHGLDLVGRLFLNPGDKIIIDRPTFSGAIVAFEMERPEYIGVDIQNDGSDIKEMENVIKGLLKSKESPPKFIYVVPDFQNPAGITTSLDNRIKLLNLSYEYDIPIIEDSPYRTLRYHGKTIPSIFSLDRTRKGNNVIGVYTFSKIFAPGIRLGFNIGHPDVIEKMVNIKEANMLNSPKLNQDLCTYFLENMDYDNYFKEMQDYYRSKLETTLDSMDEFLSPLDGLDWTKPEGGFFLWITLPEGVNTLELFYEGVDEEKVAFVPGEAFYAENPEKNHIRINYSFPTENEIKEGIKRLSRCLQKCID